VACHSSAARSDLKGANVLLKRAPGDPRGFVCKLADFGLSRVLGANTTHASINTHGARRSPSSYPASVLRLGNL
jgi:serine/threonine protein kinase